MKTKKIISIISLALIVALMVIACVGCTALDDLKDKVENALDRFVATDENGNEMIAGVSYDMPEEIMFTGLKMTGNENTGVTITATLNPESAISLVDWSLSWKNFDSWTNGKDPADYVSLTPTSNGSLTATVSMLQRFARKILITCSARADDSKYAHCEVGCYNRLTSFAELDYYTNEGSDHTHRVYAACSHFSENLSTVPVLHSDGSFNDLLLQSSYIFGYVEDDDYGFYTTYSMSIVKSIYVQASWELVDELRDQFPHCANSFTYPRKLIGGSSASGTNGFTIKDLYYAIGCSSLSLFVETSDSSNSNYVQTVRNSIDAFNRAISNCDGGWDFVITVVVENAVSEVEYEFYCQFDRSAFESNL